MTGTLAKIDAAAISPHGISCMPGNGAIPTGMVCDFGVGVDVSARGNSFHEEMKTRIPAAKIPGAPRGRKNRLNACSDVHPSIRATLYRSAEISKLLRSIKGIAKASLTWNWQAQHCQLMTGLNRVSKRQNDQPIMGCYRRG